MSLLLLAALASAADPLGPLPEGTTLRSVERHPEYLRYHLSADRDFVIELTPARDGGSPVCSGGGVDLWVRLDLAEAGESFEWDPLPAVVDQACARLADHAPTLGGRPTAADAPAQPGAEPAVERPPARAQTWSWRPLHPVVVAWMALLARLMPWSVRAWALGGLALLVRGLASPRRVVLYGDAAYQRLLSGQGLGGADVCCGDTWPALMGLLWKGLGGPADHVTAVNLGLSALTVVLLYGCLEALTKDRVVATAGALLLALLPLPVAAAGTELHFVLAAALGVAGIYGAARRDPAGALLAALSAGLLAHLRPLQLAAALVPLGLLAARRRWAALALGLGLVAWRLLEVLGQLDVVVEALSEGAPRLAAPLPGAALDPRVTPAALLILVALAALTLRDRPQLRRPAWILAAAFAATALPYLPLARDSALDPARFQLPAQTWLAALAALGMPRLLEAARPWQLALALTLAGSGWAARAPLGGPSAWTGEYRFLAREAPRIPAGTVVRSNSQDPDLAFHRWLNQRSPAEWVPLAGRPAPGEWWYRGTAERLAGHLGALPCAERVVEQIVPFDSDGRMDLGTAPLKLALFTVRECPERESE